MQNQEQSQKLLDQVQNALRLHISLDTSDGFGGIAFSNQFGAV